jgi:hypothetical protein
MVTAVLALATAVTGSALPSCAGRISRDWQFVQSVGGIAVGVPVRGNDGSVVLPVHCDVSGLQAVTQQPAAMNSALSCDAPIVRVRSQSVSITLRTSLANGRSSGSRCPDANLGGIPPGRYSVYYASPDGSEHPLGTIEVPGQ